MSNKNRHNEVIHTDIKPVTPKYNAYMGGYGFHETDKYDRKKEKESLRKEIEDFEIGEER